MGGKSSKSSISGRYSSYGSSSNTLSHNAYPQSSYGEPSHSYSQPPPAYYNPPPEAKKRLERKYSRIDDNYSTLDQVTDALAKAGLESSNLIVGVDFTKSNEWTGARSFHRRSLHHIGDEPNPYEQAISIIGRTLSKFDEDNLIPCFGFGDASTHDQEVFSFFPDERFCEGFEEVLARYRELVPQLRLAGPTSFAPVIEMAITIVEQSGGQYHVLLIIADGQVTRSVDTGRGQLSPQEKMTVDAIVKASEYPLSIVVVGVGDGPWDMMREFDDNIPARAFDNFQFVNFTEIMSKDMHPTLKEAEFALSALMEIPSQYKATLELNILGIDFPFLLHSMVQLLFQHLHLPGQEVYGQAHTLMHAIQFPNLQCRILKTMQVPNLQSYYSFLVVILIYLRCIIVTALPYLHYRTKGYGIWLWTPDVLRMRERPVIVPNLSSVNSDEDKTLLNDYSGCSQAVWKYPMVHVLKLWPLLIYYVSET